MKLTFKADASGRIIPMCGNEPIENVQFASVEDAQGEAVKLSIIVSIDHAHETTDTQAARCKS
jgi:hypothetical protein